MIIDLEKMKREADLLAKHFDGDPKLSAVERIFVCDMYKMFLYSKITEDSIIERLKK